MDCKLGHMQLRGMKSNYINESGAQNNFRITALRSTINKVKIAVRTKSNE